MENQNFEKMKKTLTDIIILHMCTINDNNMMFGSWDMEHDRQNFFAILDNFLYFYPPKNQKNHNFEKLKTTPQDIIILNMCTINDNRMMFGSWDIECDEQIFFVILD